MDWGDASFVIALVAITSFAWLANNWIRARHGYDLEDEWGGKTPPANAAANEQLAAQVRELSGTVARQGDRIKVLERIVTDRGHDVASQIEALRDQDRDTGAPIDLSRREKA